MRFKFLDRPAGARVISRLEVDPPEFQNCSMAVVYARATAPSYSDRLAKIDVIEKKTRVLKLRLRTDGKGNVTETAGAV